MTASTSMTVAAQGLKIHVHSGTPPFGDSPLFAKLFKYVSARFMKMAERRSMLQTCESPWPGAPTTQRSWRDSIS